jgi:hypothetical protein
MFSTDLSHPIRAATPTRAARSSGLKSLPLPGPVRFRNVDRIWVEMGNAGCVAEGNSGRSSFEVIVGAEYGPTALEVPTA